MPVTEIVLLHLSPTLPQSTLTRVLDQASSTLLAQPGCLSYHGLFALEAESLTSTPPLPPPSSDPSAPPASSSKKYQMFIVWTSVEQHMVWTRDPKYKPFLEALSEIEVPGKPAVWFHVDLIPSSAQNVLDDSSGTEDGGPVVEIAQMYFHPPSILTPSYRAEFNGTLSTFLSSLHKTFPAESTGNSAFGFAIEEAPVEYPIGNGKGGEKVKERCGVVVGLLGWKSKKDHLKVAVSEELQKLWMPVQESKGVVGVDMWHLVRNPEAK